MPHHSLKHLNSQINIILNPQRTLRVFCREKAPVGGIPIKEHFEINLAPVTIALTYQFFKKMLKFCFPEKDPDHLDEEREEGAEKEPPPPKKKGKGITSRKHKDSAFYVPIKDDVEKMKVHLATFQSSNSELNWMHINNRFSSFYL